MNTITRRLHPSSVGFRLYDPAAVAPLWLRIATMVVGLALSAVVIDLTSSSTSIYSSIWLSTFGGASGLTGVGQLATPLILAGAAVAVARRVNLWNVGVDGQLIMGAWVATLVARNASSLPGGLLAVVMMLAAMLGGALWVLGPALARAYLKVNEVITTLMLNFIAGLWLTWFATGPWGTNGSQLGALSTEPVPESTFLPDFNIGSFTVGLGLIIAIVVVVLLALAFRYLRFGYHANVASGEEVTARYAGVDQGRVQVFAFLLSGAIGGLAGAVMELDQIHSLSTALTSNTGYIGLVIAVLAGASLLGVLPVGLLLAVVVAAGNGLRIAGVSADLVLLVTGLLLLMGGAADLLVRYRLRFSSPIAPDDPQGTPEAPASVIASSTVETTP